MPHNRCDICDDADEETICDRCSQGVCYGCTAERDDVVCVECEATEETPDAD